MVWWLLSKDLGPKREQEAGGSCNAFYHLALEVMQGHSCHLPFVEEAMKSLLGSMGREINPASGQGVAKIGNIAMAILGKDNLPDRSIGSPCAECCVEALSVHIWLTD